MGKYETIDSEISTHVPCPCKKGAYVVRHVTREDDFMRQHSDYETSITCRECDNKYMYYRNSWIKKDGFREIQGYIAKRNNLKDELYVCLYNMYMPYFRNSFTTKKALYDFLKVNDVVCALPTMNTFYKNGVDHYIGIKFLGLNNLKKIIKVSKIKKTDAIEKIKEYDADIKGLNERIDNWLLINKV